MKNKIITAGFIIVVLGALLSVGLINNIVKKQSNIIYAATQTTTQEENLEKHYEYYKLMISKGFYDDEISLIKDYCKKVPEGGSFHNCLAMTTAIKVAENGQSAVNRKAVSYSHNNLFSFRNQYGHVEYNSRIESIEDFMEHYNRLWYKLNCTEMLTKANYVGYYNENWKYNCLYILREFDQINN